MGMIQEFKEFASKGNVMDMAVGIIIGAAFGDIVKSLVNDVLMPPLGYVMGKVDFSKIVIQLPVPAIGSEPATSVDILIGKWINTVVNFLIVAFCIFLVVKAVNRLKKPTTAAPPAPPADVVLLTEIRDLLKRQ